MCFEMDYCFPFFRRLTRKGKVLHVQNDQPQLPSEQKTTHLISGKEKPTNLDFKGVRFAETNELTQSSHTHHPASPPSSTSKNCHLTSSQLRTLLGECEFYDCLSELSNHLNTSQNLEGILESPKVTQTPQSSLWTWMMGWTGQSGTLTPDKEVIPEQRSLEESNSCVEDPMVVASCSTIEVDHRPGVLSACMNLMSHTRHPQLTSLDTKLIAGTTFARKRFDQDFEIAKECWKSADATKYKIRSKNYLKTGIKESCSGSFYEVIGSDLFSFDKKQPHVAQLVELPEDPYTRTAEELEAIEEYGLPTLLVVNMQLPVYQPSFFGSDGRGHSFVFYCVLHENFDPRTYSNQCALNLFKRFIANPENQGQYRIKLIPKFLNIEEWAQRGPLTQTEHRLVKMYNEKPILTRQHNRFFKGPNYFEIDVDVHQWIYIAKKAFWSLLIRMHQVVTEVALLIQGNASDDLPEQIVAACRVYRVDLARFRYFADYKQQLTASTSQQKKCLNGTGEVAQEQQDEVE